MLHIFFSSLYRSMVSNPILASSLNNDSTRFAAFLHNILRQHILTHSTSILCTKICMPTYSYPRPIPVLSMIAWFPV